MRNVVGRSPSRVLAPTGALVLAAVLLAPPAAGAPAELAHACPDPVPAMAFEDVGDGPHTDAIACLVAWEITAGASDEHYAPQGSVTREQMATFLVRLLAAADADLPVPEESPFDDVGGVHGENVDALAAAGLAQGTGPTSFSPAQEVSRAQLATFLARALEHLQVALDAGTEGFDDVDPDSVHAAAIASLTEAGIVQGRTATTYDPSGVVTRAQMASLLMRTADVLVHDGVTGVPYVDPEPDPDPDPEPDPEPEPTNRMHGGDRLRSGEQLMSSNGDYRLRMQGDGNLVLLDGSSPVWATGTDGNAGAALWMQGDGNAVVVSSAGTPLWATGTDGNSGAYLTLQNDRNLVLTGSGGRVLWATGTEVSEPPPGPGPGVPFAHPHTDFRITQVYGNYYVNEDFGIAGYHAGVDSVGHGGSATIVAMAPGTVVSFGNQGGWGNYVILRHVRTDGVTVHSVYAHLASHASGLSVGRCLDRGASLGVMGATGTATGPHLHFEIKNQGTLGSGYYGSHPDNHGYSDPMGYIGTREAQPC